MNQKQQESSMLEQEGIQGGKYGLAILIKHVGWDSLK
jgi:hypothetical protein